MLSDNGASIREKLSSMEMVLTWGYWVFNGALLITGVMMLHSGLSTLKFM